MRDVLLIALLLPIAAAPVGAQTPEARSERKPITKASVDSRGDVDQPLQRRPRRRPSMVGYVEDATIASRIRVRFDAGFHNFVPDRGEYFYAKCGCYRDLPSTNPAFDPDAPGPRPGAAADLNFQQLYLAGEYAFNARVSAFAQVPVRWIQPQEFAGGGQGFSNQSGLGDLQLGVKYGLIDKAALLVTAQVQAYLSTGDAAKGLGTDHNSIEPALLYYQRVSDRLVLESQAGVWLPLNGSAGVPTLADEKFAGSIIFYGIGPSYVVHRSGRLQIAPVVELVGWRVLDGFQTDASADASGTNILNLKVGARASLERGSFYVGYGTALTSTSWYEDIIRVEYRHLF